MDSVPAMPEPRAGDRFTLRPWTLNAGDLALVQESASSVWAWERRNARQVCWDACCGAGGRPERRSTRRIMAAATR